MKPPAHDHLDLLDADTLAWVRRGRDWDVAVPAHRKKPGDDATIINGRADR